MWRQTLSSVLKWALIFFGMTIFWICFEKWMGWHGPQIGQHATFSLFYDGLFVLVFLLAFRDQRHQDPEFGSSWHARLLYGLALTLAVTALSPIVQYLWHQVISPEFFPNIIEMAVEHQILSKAQAEAQFNLASYIRQNLIGTFIFGVLSTGILSIFIRNRH